MSLNTRLTRLEHNRPRAVDRFPGWEMLAGQPPDRWLAERGYTTLVQAVVAGESDPLLMVFALEEWLSTHHYADALDAVEAGHPIPPGLERALRESAEYDRRHRAYSRAEKALAARELPDDADVQAVQR